MNLSGEGEGGDVTEPLLGCVSNGQVPSQQQLRDLGLDAPKMGKRTAEKAVRGVLLFKIVHVSLVYP